MLSLYRYNRKRANLEKTLFSVLPLHRAVCPVHIFGMRHATDKSADVRSLLLLFTPVVRKLLMRICTRATFLLKCFGTLWASFDLKIKSCTFILLIFLILTPLATINWLCCVTAAKVNKSYSKLLSKCWLHWLKLLKDGLNIHPLICSLFKMLLSLQESTCQWFIS